jgi:hypothetical protein
MMGIRQLLFQLIATLLQQFLLQRALAFREIWQGVKTKKNTKKNNTASMSGFLN